MACVTIAELPESLLMRIQERAASDRRSLEQEVVALLELALGKARAPEPEWSDEDSEAQYRAWCQLGVGQSDGSAEEEIRDIVSRRTPGRHVEL